MSWSGRRVLYADPKRIARAILARAEQLRSTQDELDLSQADLRWARAQFDELRAELRWTRAMLAELRALVLARRGADRELAGLYRERALQRARAAERDLSTLLH
jgi:hypothetical protein